MIAFSHGGFKKKLKESDIQTLIPPPPKKIMSYDPLKLNPQILAKKVLYANSAIPHELSAVLQYRKIASFYICFVSTFCRTKRDLPIVLAENHRREGKGRRCSLGDRIASIPCLASCFAPGWHEEEDELHQDDMKKRMNYPGAKQLAWQRIE